MAEALQMVAVEDVVEVITPPAKIQTSDFLESGKYPIVDQSKKRISGYWNRQEDVVQVRHPVVIFGDHTRAVKYVDFDFVVGADGVKILSPDQRFVPKFFFYALRNLKITNLGYSRHFKELKKQRIPVIPIERQMEIVLKLDQAETLEGLREKSDTLLSSFAPALFHMMFGGLGTNQHGYILQTLEDLVTISKQKAKAPPGSIYISLEDIEAQTGKLLVVRKDRDVKGVSNVIRKGDILYGKLRPALNKVILSDIDGYASTELVPLRPKAGVESRWIESVLRSTWFVEKAVASIVGANLPRANMRALLKLKVPTPPLKSQQTYAASVEMAEGLKSKQLASAELIGEAQAALVSSFIG